MKFSTFLLVAICTLMHSTYPQGTSPINRKAGVGAAVKIKVPLAGTMVGRARCDDGGNIYIRVMDAEMARLQHGIYRIPIEKIRPDGSVGRTFRITDLSPDAYAKDFFVTGDGRVFQTVFMSDTSVYVADFDASGPLRSKISLDAAGVDPYQIAVFDTGEVLLSGTIAKQHYRPFTGVFNVHGKLIKEIYEPEDEASWRAANNGDPDVLPEYAPRGNTFAWRSDAAIGSDGNAYLLRAASPGLVYVISRQGQLIRKFRIDPGTPGLVARSLKPGPGILVVSFLDKGMLTGVMKVVDVRGKLISSHSFNDAGSERIPGLPGCYVSNALTILEDDAQHNVFIRRVELR